jgi:hypothetical protein
MPHHEINHDYRQTVFLREKKMNTAASECQFEIRDAETTVHYVDPDIETRNSGK